MRSLKQASALAVRLYPIDPFIPHFTVAAHRYLPKMKPPFTKCGSVWCRAFLLTALGVCSVAPTRAVAQRDTLGAAVRLRDAGQFEAAAALLGAYLRGHPGHGDAARILSLTLYWTKDIAAARAVAESSLALHPEDTSLRLQYGRMLIEIGDAARAHEVLAPVRDTEQRGPATGLLGTLAYWRGDYTTARSLFAESLRSDPDQPEVRRQLGELLVLSAPWTAGHVRIVNDDQPIDVWTVTAEAGWFLTPLVHIAARVSPKRFRLADSATRTLGIGAVSATAYVPSWRTEVSASLGGLRRSFGSTGDWVVGSAAALRLGEVTLRLRGERSPYLYTEASLSTPVMATTLAAAAGWSHPRGWLAEAALESQRFPDTNSVRTLYAWVLAPILRGAGGDLRIGYSGTNQDAVFNRFALANTTQTVPPDDPGFDLSGRYVPYYTPDHRTSHAVIAAGTVRLSPKATLRANGSYGVRARENFAAFVITPASPPQQASVGRVVATRAFTPWNAHLELVVAGDDGVTLTMGGELTRAAFYTAGTIDLALAYRFGLAARRAAAGY